MLPSSSVPQHNAGVTLMEWTQPQETRACYNKPVGRKANQRQLLCRKWAADSRKTLACTVTLCEVILTEWMRSSSSQGTTNWMPRQKNKEDVFKVNAVLLWFIPNWMCWMSSEMQNKVLFIYAANKDTHSRFFPTPNTFIAKAHTIHNLFIWMKII